MSQTSIFVTVKPRATYKRGANALGLRILPNARKTFTCREDRHGNLVTGHTIEEWNKYTTSKKENYKDFWKSYSVSMTDTEIQLDITQEEDLIKYKFLLSQSPEIIEEGKGEITSGTQYIIINEENKAEERNKGREDLMKAMSILHEMTADQKAGFLRLYGMKTDNLSPVKITDELCDRIEAKRSKDTGMSGAADFIAKYEAKDKNDRILLKNLIQNEIITVKGMSIYYGTDLIGASEDLAVEFLKDPKNAELKANFVSMIRAKRAKE